MLIIGFGVTEVVRTDPRHDHGMSSALSPVSRRAATVRSAWRRPARTVADCPRSESLPAAGGQPGFCKETAMCRRADHAGGSAIAHIGRGALFRSSPKAHHRTGQVAWRSAVPCPGCLDGGGQTQGSGEAHRDVLGACFIKPGNTSPPDGAASTDHPLQDLTSTMQRFPAAGLAEQEKRPSQSPATNVASISPRHLSGFVTSQLLRGAGLCRSRPARKGSKLRGSVALHWLLPAPPHPARSSDIRPNSTGWANFA
jgi:hypothetical protein